MTVPWSTTFLRMGDFVTEFAPASELPLEILQTSLPFVTIVGLGGVVWWRGRRDGGETRRWVEVTVEMPTPYTLICVLGYLTAMVLVLDFRIPMLLLPLTLLGICNTRFSTRRPTDVGSEAVIPETPVMSRESYRNVTPPSSRHSRKLFHIHDDDEINGPLSRKATPHLLLTPPPTVPRRRYISYEPQTPPIPRTERPSPRIRVSSTPSNDIRRSRGSASRRYASENPEENLVPKKEVWDTSFELLLYNLSKSRSRNSSLVQPQPRFNVSSPISTLAPSPLINSS